MSVNIEQLITAYRELINLALNFTACFGNNMLDLKAGTDQQND